MVTVRDFRNATSADVNLLDRGPAGLLMPGHQLEEFTSKTKLWLVVFLRATLYSLKILLALFGVSKVAPNMKMSFAGGEVGVP